MSLWLSKQQFCLSPSALHYYLRRPFYYLTRLYCALLRQWLYISHPSKFSAIVHHVTQPPQPIPADRPHITNYISTESQEELTGMWSSKFNNTPHPLVTGSLYTLYTSWELPRANSNPTYTGDSFSKVQNIFFFRVRALWKFLPATLQRGPSTSSPSVEPGAMGRQNKGPANTTFTGVK